MYEPVLSGAFILPNPWNKERHRGQLRIGQEVPNTYNCSAQLSGQFLLQTSRTAEVC